MSDILDDRRRALEEQFFKAQNEFLVKKLKEAAAMKASAETIRELTGIRNQKVIDSLAAMKIGAATATVMSIFPLIEIAWSDGKVTPKERKVIIEQAHVLGLEMTSDAGAFLAHWLDEQPDLATHNLWAEYVKELAKVMPPAEKELLKNELVGRARLVAEASAGFLGLGFGISVAEKDMLKKLEKAFD